MTEAPSHINLKLKKINEAPSHIQLKTNDRIYATCPHCNFSGDTIYFNSPDAIDRADKNYWNTPKICGFCEMSPIITQYREILQVQETYLEKPGFRTILTAEELASNDFPESASDLDLTYTITVFEPGSMLLQIYDIFLVDD